MSPGSSDIHQPNWKILQIHTNSLFFSYSILKELQENLSDRPKIMEKFSQPADENGHVLLPGVSSSEWQKVKNVFQILILHWKIHGEERYIYKVQGEVYLFSRFILGISLDNYPIFIWGFWNRVCLSVRREKKSPWLRQDQSYIK